MIGVLDYLTQKDKRSSYNSANALCYYGNGEKFPENVKEGSGFKMDDTVIVRVNRARRIIEYFVNGKFQASHMS